MARRLPWILLLVTACIGASTVVVGAGPGPSWRDEPRAGGGLEPADRTSSVVGAGVASPPAGTSAKAASAAADEAAGVLSSFLASWCLDCHAGPRAKGDFDLAPTLAMLEGASDADPRPLLTALARFARPRLVAREMPPREPMPAEEEYRAAIAAIDAMAVAHPAPDPPSTGHPGRVTARRLNRYEYANTVRDLLGVDFDPARLPVDDVGHGFDNNGDVLTIPPLLLEKYLDAAEGIAAEALVELERGEPATLRLHGIQLRGSGGARDAGKAWSLYSNGQVEGRVQVSRPGRYRISAVVLGQQAGPDPVQMTVLCDGRSSSPMAVEGHLVERTLEQEIELREGAHRVGAAFVNDYYRPEHPDPAQRDRNAFVKEIALTGPLDRPQPSPLQQELATWTREAPRADHLRIITREMASRAWRRPVDEGDVAALLAVADGAEVDAEQVAGLSAQTRRLRTVLAAILVHPRFLFRLEGEPAEGETDRALDPWEVASRLSYFLWSTAPDETLRHAAATGELATGAGRIRQVRRMLADPRSLAMGEHFATQWLRIRSLEERMPDPDRFSVEPALLESMRQETVLFFDDIMRRGRPVSELLHCDQTFLNEALARHYGIGGVRGDHLRRVSLAGLAAEGGGRAEVNDLGLLRHASVLLATSNPSRTSPVKRGKWVLEALLDEPPPPAPPGVPPLPEDAGDRKGLSLRELMERHRADPDCAGCHRRMDAMGFSLEEFDAVGRFRREDDGRPIDSTAELPDGRIVAGAAGLRDELLRGDAFVTAFVRHLLTYALGRGLVEADHAAVAEIVAAAGSEPTIAAIVEGIVESRPFQHRAAAQKP